MIPTRVLRAAAYRPLIKFKGRLTPPSSIDHSPQPHPAAPSSSLPDSFANYRSKAQQHGPLGGQQQSQQSRNSTTATSSSSSPPTSSATADSPGNTHIDFAGQSMVAYGRIGGHSGHELGSIEPREGEVFDRSQLPARFQPVRWTEREIEAVESGGASMW